MAPRLPNLTLQGVRIVFRNFAGKADQYNREGDRNFSVVLDAELAEKMRADGWNVKTRPPKDEGDEEFHTLSVSVSYKGRPPRMVMVSSRGRTNLEEEDIEMLDWAYFETVDLILNPYQWSVQGKSGIKAYLHAGYFTIMEDELELKYADIPEIGATTQRLAIEGPGGADDIIDVEAWDVKELEV